MSEENKSFERSYCKWRFEDDDDDEDEVFWAGMVKEVESGE